MNDITKSFSGVEVLSSVGFNLKAGEVHVLAGENGAGKSTLIKILAGVYDDYSGSIELKGCTVRFRSPRDAADRGIAVIHQEMSLIGPMSVAGNIFLGREKTTGGFWMNVKRQRAGAAQLLHVVGLDVDPSSPLERLPLGAQQLIEIAKALALNAGIIIMDEPTSSLNDLEVEKLFGIIGLLRARGVGIVYITHKLEEIYRVADRITVLRDGKLIGTATPGELSRTELIRWMVGRDISQQFPQRTSSPGNVRLKAEHLFFHDPLRNARSLVEDVSFEVRSGEIVGIAGLQGSGNSELLNGLFGVYGKPASGTVVVDGAVREIASPGRAVRHGLAFLTNDRKTGGLVMAMGIAHNITLAALRSYSPGGWLRSREERAAALRQEATLHFKAASIDQEVATLSGGNQQKIVLAKWLETHPKVFLLDEPTRGIDVGVKHEVYGLIDRWASEGCAILLVTSEMPELLAMADRILVMCRGRVTAEFGRNAATQERIMHAAMGAGELVH